MDTGPGTTVLPNSYKQAGQKPMRFVAPASQLTDLGDDDLVIVRFSRTDHSTMPEPLPVASLSLA